MVLPPTFFLRSCFLLWFAASSARLASAAETPALAGFHEAVQPLLVQYCYDCHGDGARKGKVAFDGFGSDSELIAKTDLWLAALKNVRAGIMPPADEPRPSAAEIARLENWIKYQAFGIDPANPDPGRITVRRLNRVEYRNTIRDLMGIDFNSEAEFPPDDTGHGFDNLGEVLTVSPLLLEKYLQAAEEVVDKAVPRVARVPARRVAGAKDFRRDEGPSGDLTVRKGGKRSHTFTITTEGAYKVSFEAAVRNSFDFDDGRGTLIIVVDGTERKRQDIVWGGPTVRYESEEHWTAGPHRISVELQPLNEPAATTPEPEAMAPAVVQTAVAELPKPAAGAGGDAPPTATRRLFVDVRITSAQVKGPMEEKFWVPPENYRRFFSGETPTAPDARDMYAKQVLRDFATRAFRRPVEESKVAQLFTIARSVYTEPGQRFEDGIARAMMGVLASPRFLFRIEQPAPDEAEQAFAAVDEYALASRLSYFLWSSMPDEELSGLAARGELRRELPAQVKRMLKDSKAQAFVRNFPGQWLQARDIETVPINARAVLGQGNPRGNRAARFDFDGPLRKAMRAETEMVFDYVLRENRSVLEFIESDYTFLNAKLATHYGIPGVDGEELRRVTLPADSPRGGVLTQGTVLAVTSNPTRTSPVKRGLFVLENILGTPPPPPPPDIPALEESQKDAGGRQLTLREALASHRSNKLCASCHARMDPLGFALENFNAMGNWRELDAKQPIDPAGQLATGEAFADIRELKRILTHERRLDYYRCLTEKMLTYALGRGLDYYDVEAVDRIVERLENEQGRFSALLTGIIESTPFQKLRHQPSASKVTLALSPPHE